LLRRNGIGDIVRDEPTLADRHCVPCKKGTPALTKAQCGPLLSELQDWTVVSGHHLARELRFEDFAQALAFVNRVGEIAETEGHHPDIRLGWGRVGIEVWTHSIDGLSEADFVLAAKIDRIAT
jgi:4a-hydroxytetrahydrobiopterin dehydratase